MTTVTRWIFESDGAKEYIFPRNPDRMGGDTGWIYESRYSELDPVGANYSHIQIDGFRSGKRTLRFTGITGTMMRHLQDFYLAHRQINNCRDHLYSTTIQFNCYIVAFTPTTHPTLTDEDKYDMEMTLVRIT